MAFRTRFARRSGGRIGGNIEKDSESDLDADFEAGVLKSASMLPSTRPPKMMQKVPNPARAKLEQPEPLASKKQQQQRRLRDELDRLHRPAGDRGPRARSRGLHVPLSQFKWNNC